MRRRSSQSSSPGQLLVLKLTRQLQGMVQGDLRPSHDPGHRVFPRLSVGASSHGVVQRLFERHAFCLHGLADQGLRIRVKCHRRSHADSMASEIVMPRHHVRVGFSLRERVLEVLEQVLGEQDEADEPIVVLAGADVLAG